MKWLLLVVALLVASPAMAQDRDHWWVDSSLLAAGVSSTVDLSTTAWAKGQGGDRFTELNPLLRPFADHPVKLAIAKSAIDGALLWVMLKEHKRKPKTIFVAALVKTAASSYFAYRNMQTLERRIK